MDDQFLGLRSEIWRSMSVVAKKFSPHCLFGLLKLMFHLLNSLVEAPEKFGKFSFMEAEPFERFYVLVEKSYKIRPRRLLKRIHETLETMSEALASGQRPKAKVREVWFMHMY